MANTEGQRLYSEWIENLRRFWIGRRVKYAGEDHTVVEVDYNGMLLIDKPAQFTPTTAVATTSLDDYRTHQRSMKGGETS